MAVYDDDEFDSSQEALAHYTELLKALRARKRALDIQSAKYGLAVPAHVVTEQEEVNAEVQRLREQIKKLEGGTTPPALATESAPVKKLLKFALEQVVVEMEERKATNWRGVSPEEIQLEILRKIVFGNFFNTLFGDYTPMNDKTLAEQLYMSIELIHTNMDVLEKAGYIVVSEIPLVDQERRFIPLWSGQSVEIVRTAIPTDKGREWIDSQDS